MKWKLVICFLAITSPLFGQTIVGDRPTAKEAAVAEQTLQKLQPKRLTMQVGEFEELIPANKGETPYLWLSSDDEVVRRYEVEKGKSFGIIGKKRGSKGSAYDYHEFAPREYRWAIIIVTQKPVPVFTADGKPAVRPVSIHVIKGTDQKTAEPADHLIITVGDSVPDIDPVKPDIKPDVPVKPDVKPSVDAELVKTFKESLKVDKDEAVKLGIDWKYAAIWAKTYSDTSSFLKLNDPAVAPKIIKELYEKHKATWLVEEVPARPFLENTRRVIDGILTKEFGIDTSKPLDRSKASDLFKQLGNALTEALK